MLRRRLHDGFFDILFIFFFCNDFVNVFFFETLESVTTRGYSIFSTKNLIESGEHILRNY